MGTSENKSSVSPWVWVCLAVFALVVGVPLATCGACSVYTVYGTSHNAHPTLRKGDKCESTSQCEGSSVCRDGVCK